MCFATQAGCDGYEYQKKYKEEGKGKRSRLKTWKLRSATGREEFDGEVGKIMVQGKSTQERWNSLEQGLKKVAEKVCGQSKGGRNVGKRGGGMKRLQKSLRRKKRCIRNGGKTEARRIWTHIRC